MTVHARRYHSTLRDEQAQETRRRIVRAGGELYVERGYGGTTIDAIAERAEVSRKTVFTAVGGKARLLKLAFDWALAGDDEPVAIADRPDVRRMMQQQDPALLLAEWIAMNAAIAGRLAALHHVLVVAADGDTEAAAVLTTAEQQRAHGVRTVMTRLDAIGGLRPGLDIDRATAITELLIDPWSFGTSSSSAAGRTTSTPSTSSAWRQPRSCRDDPSRAHSNPHLTGERTTHERVDGLEPPDHRGVPRQRRQGGRPLRRRTAAPAPHDRRPNRPGTRQPGDVPGPRRSGGRVRLEGRHAQPPRLVPQPAPRTQTSAQRSAPRRARFTTRIATGDERARIWAQQKQDYPGFADYEAATDREIPVVILDPI